jgi:hypothetical protein
MVKKVMTNIGLLTKSIKIPAIPDGNNVKTTKKIRKEN